MQEKNRSSSHFSQRTEALAERWGVLLRDLAPRIGFSQRMLFGYRSGKYPITEKAWRKLEAAERAAGIVAGGERKYEAAEVMGERVQDEPSDSLFAGLPPDIRAAAKAIAEAVVQRILPRLEARLEAIERRILKSEAWHPCHVTGKIF